MNYINNEIIQARTAIVSVGNSNKLLCFVESVTTQWLT
jgi:hypothetical protein